MDRRSFLRTFGVSSALLPFLPLLNAEGMEPLFPKRLLLFYAPDGVAAIDDGGAVLDWRPRGTETDFTLASIHEPLMPFQSRIVVPHGMRFSAGGAGQEHAYGMSGLWSGATLNGPSGDANFDGGNGLRTGWGSGPSIDQIIAAHAGPDAPYQRPPDDPEPETAYRTLELGVQCADPHSMHRMIYRGNDQPIHPETNPRAAFDRLFMGLMPGSGDTMRGNEARRASLELLMRETERLRGRVGSREYPKIEAHLEGLAVLERQLSTPVEPADCTAPARVPEEATSRFENSATFPAEAEAMMDIVAHAFACDLTRVASIQLSRGFSQIVHSWVGATQGHHTISHNDGDNRAILSSIDTWYAAQFAAMLAKLDAIPEGDGSLLDNTLVVWGREMATTSHRMQPVPLIFAGNARGGLRTGRFLDVDREPHAKALVSICQLMGLEVNGVGDRDPDSGPLPGLV